jgi:hypothetical protein
MTRRSQLRIYTLAPDTAEEFVANFRRELVPLRDRYGFSVDCAYLADDRTRFTWVTSHDCPDGWETAERTYYDSPERASISFKPGDYILAHDVTMVEPA